MENQTQTESEKLVEKFNEIFPVGSTVMWRSIAIESVEHQPFTVISKATLLNGQPIVCFAEKHGYVSIEPVFVDYPASQALQLEKLQVRIFELEQIKNKTIKPFYEEYEKVCASLHKLLGENAYFQVEETVFKTVVPDGKFVKFERFGIVRTRFESETKGSLSMKEAKENGFDVEVKK